MDKVLRAGDFSLHHYTNSLIYMMIKQLNSVVVQNYYTLIHTLCWFRIVLIANNGHHDRESGALDAIVASFPAAENRDG